ncbi:MAG: hypothetical protein ABFD79_14700 [Phycisphaerales bacterium]
MKLIYNGEYDYIDDLPRLIEQYETAIENDRNLKHSKFFNKRNSMKITFGGQYYNCMACIHSIFKECRPVGYNITITDIS